MSYILIPLMRPTKSTSVVAVLSVYRWRKSLRAARSVWIVMLTLSGWICGAEVQAADVVEPFRVMILRNTSQYLPATILQDRGMREALAAPGTRSVEFFVETMDTMWFDRAEIEPEFLSLFRKKYGSRKIDLLMAAGADSLDFAQRFRELLLPGVPIVFYNVSEDALRGRALQPGITGVVLRFNLPGTLDLAMRLQPGARRMIVVSGTSPYDKNWARRTREALRPYEGRLEVSYWSGQPLQQLLENLRQLPVDTIVLYLAFSDDGAGHTYAPADLARPIAAASAAPVYGVLETYFGQGIVGGAFPSFEAHGKLAGQVALRVLAGEKPENIPVRPSHLAVASVDWRELRRWGISESRLPPGSIVQFRQPTFWEQYRWYIVGALAIIALQAVLIVGLLLHRARRRRAEAKLRESQEFMELSTSAGELGLWVRDLARGDLWANQRLRSLFGFGQDDVLRFDDVVARIHPDDRSQVVSLAQQAQDDGLPFEVDFRVVSNGTERWIAVKGRSVGNAPGHAMRRMGALIDITARKQAEFEAQRKRDELAHVSRVSVMGELTASMAHELNQPLGAILSNAEAAELFLQADPPALDEVREILADIRRDDQRAGEIIHEVRTLLRKQTLGQQAVQINEAVEAIINLLKNDAATRKVNIQFQRMHGLPQVRGDRVQLHQVLLNLVLNGLDAMTEVPEERRQLVVRTSAGDNDTVGVAVCDRGPGVPTDKLGKLFEPFFTTKKEGMGMGLSIARTIIEAHHGEIWAENNADCGMTFYFTLPVVG